MPWKGFLMHRKGSYRMEGVLCLGKGFLCIGRGLIAWKGFYALEKVKTR